MTLSLPQMGKQPKGSIPLPPLVQSFQLNSLPSEGPTRRPSDPKRGGKCSQNSKDLIYEPLIRIKFLKIVQKVRIYSVIWDFYRAKKYIITVIFSLSLLW